VIFKYSAIADPKIAEIRHKIQTLGSVLLKIVINADWRSISIKEGIGGTFPDMTGSSANEKVIMKSDKRHIIKYPIITSFRSASSIPGSMLAINKNR